MQKCLWRAENGACHHVAALYRHRLASLPVVGAVAVVLPAYHDVEYAVPNEAGAGPRSTRRPKPQLSAPRPELLKPQNPPDCEEKKATAARPTPNNGVAHTAAVRQASAAELQPSLGAEPIDRNAELAMRVKLEYERECYRQAEMRSRDRLRQLQSSVGGSIKSVNRKAEE
jgi:hypothetical protein